MGKRTSSQFARLAAAVAVAFFFLSAAPTAQEVPAVETEAAPTEVAAPRFQSPRAAFGFFLESMLADRPSEVVESGVLDLSAYPDGERERVGRERAELLYQSLNRTEYIELEEIPDVDHGRGWWTYRGYPPGETFRVVRVEFEQSEPVGWRISGETVARVPDIWESVRELPTIEAYRENLPILRSLRLELRERMPEALLGEVFLLENWQWAGLAILTLLCVILDRLARFAMGALLRKIAGHSAIEKEDVIRFERPVGILVAALLFQQLLPILGVDEELRTLLDLAAGTLATIAGVWAAYKLVDVICGYLSDRARRTSNKFDDMLVPLLRRTLKIFVTVVGLIYLASLVSEDLWGVVAGLSIGSLAIGFAARDSIENLFGTFTVLLDKPFQLGDWIVTGDMEGTVEEVGFRSTRIRTFYDSVISVPNRHFISTSVDNLGVRRYRRIKTMLSLTYDTPPEKVEAFCEGVREILRQHPYTRKDYYHVYLTAFSAASLDVLLYCFLACPDWGTELREKQRLFLDVLRLAKRLEVDFAFPTQTIHMARPEDLEHSNVPETDVEGTRRGRAAGEEVAKDTLRPFGGDRPRPVSFDPSYLADQVRE